MWHDVTASSTYRKIYSPYFNGTLSCNCGGGSVSISIGDSCSQEFLTHLTIHPKMKAALKSLGTRANAEVWAGLNKLNMSFFGTSCAAGLCEKLAHSAGLDKTAVTQLLNFESELDKWFVFLISNHHQIIKIAELLMLGICPPHICHVVL